LGVPKPFQFFFRTAGYAVFLNFYEGRTQTLSGFTKLRFVVPLELGVPKPFQQNAAHFVVFFASHLFTKASF
jgi:hypothetical protein